MPVHFSFLGMEYGYLFLKYCKKNEVMRSEEYGKNSKTKRNRLNMRKKDELMNIQGKMTNLDTRVGTKYTGCSTTLEFPIMNKFSFSILDPGQVYRRFCLLEPRQVYYKGSFEKIKRAAFGVD